MSDTDSSAEDTRRAKKARPSKEKKKKLKKEKKKKREKQPTLYQRVGYTTESNPFGDTNLNQQFVWKKKAEKEGTEGKHSDKRAREDHFFDEIQKVRNRRFRTAYPHKSVLEEHELAAVELKKAASEQEENKKGRTPWRRPL